MKTEIRIKENEYKVTSNLTSLIKRRLRTKLKLVENENAYIVSVKDSLGNSFIPETHNNYYSGYCKTKNVLKAGNLITFEVNAINPNNDSLEYAIDYHPRSAIKWQSGNKLYLQLSTKHISRFFQIRIKVRSTRKFQPVSIMDDSVIFSYQVDPN